MHKDCDKIIGNISENDISIRLLPEYFDGVVLIDIQTEKVISVSDYLTGRFKNYINFSTATYSDNVNILVDRLIPSSNVKTVKNALDLKNIIRILDLQDTYNVDFHMKKDESDKILYKRMCFRYFDSNKKYIVLVCEDTSDIIASDTDPLTELYNLSGFHKNVNKWIKENPGKRYRIQRYNIDRFKDINGVYGYDMGNQLLRDCGYHMKKLDTNDSFSAHLNADHFVRFCSEDSLSVQEYYDFFTKCFEGYNLKMPISIHMGVYDLCEDGCNTYTMSYKALLALQSAKGNFNKPIAYYEKGMMDFEMEQQEFLNDVDKAIENDEFEVWFQPQINYKDKELVGAEALVRWKHPKRGLLAPGLFLPIFESSDKICNVDKYIINKTCQYMRKWMDEMPDKKIIVSVNLSRIDIQRPNFAEKLKNIVDSNNVPVSNIRLEITESAYLDNSEILLSVVDDLKEKGFIIEMDDFGSGYSSLNTLKDIDIDVLKLDMRFLAGEKNTKRSEVIISSVISMASALGLPVIAEGVETRRQADMLLGFGCCYMQGYYFSKPVHADEYKKMLCGQK